MADKDQDNRVFVGGLSWDVTERQLESAFSRYGKIIDCQVMTERETGRPRGFGFLTFADRRDMDEAIREMNGRELGDRVISVNKAQPKTGDESPRRGYGGYSSSATGRSSYGRVGKTVSAGSDDCFKCGRPGHWARECPSAGGPARYARPPLSPPRGAKYSGGVGGARGDRYPVERERFMDDRYDNTRGRYGDRDRYESRDDRYGSQDRFVGDRYHPPPSDRFPVDRYGPPDRYPVNDYGKDRLAYDRGEGPRGGGGGGGSDRYGARPTRYEGRGYRERPGPYDRPPPRRGGPPPPAIDRY